MNSTGLFTSKDCDSEAARLRISMALLIQVYKSIPK